MRVLSLLFLIFATSVLFSAGAPEVTSAAEAVRNHLLVRVVPLEYDYEARARHMEGDGVFDLIFDYETGHLREVHVVRALSSSRLQKTTIAALKQWQAKPRSIHVLRVPIAFLIGSRTTH